MKYKEKKKLIRSYKLKNHSNKGKLQKLENVFVEYRKTAIKIAKKQWKYFFLSKEEANFDKNMDIKLLDSKLSARYKQTCQYQVVGILDSFLSNIQTEFKEYVIKSSISDEIKRDLFTINLNKEWLKNSAIMVSNIYNNKNKIDEYRTIRYETVKLARKIFKHLLLTKNSKPYFGNINMALDSKVARVEKKKTSGKDVAKKYDFWLHISTLEAGKIIKIPLSTNQYFESKNGIVKNFLQVNQNNITKELSFSPMKEIPNLIDTYKNNVINETIAIDLGLRNLFATNYGDLIGRNFIDKLYDYDKKITKLASELQKHKIKLNKNLRYRKLVNKIKNYLKNEINRCLNTIIKIHNPLKIIMERLDFKSPALNKRMNRILSKFGKGILTKRLENLEELYGIEIVYINPAYTSQECPSCGNVDKRNRTSQKNHCCTFCGKISNADVTGGKNIDNRSSMVNVSKKSNNSNLDVTGIYVPRKKILDVLLTRFIERSLRHYSLPNFRNRTQDNKYLAEHDFYQKNVVEKLAII
jgi:putative transposase